MSKMKKIHIQLAHQSRDVIQMCIAALQAINDEALTSEHLQSATATETHNLTALLNRNNRVIEKLQEEVTVW